MSSAVKVLLLPQTGQSFPITFVCAAYCQRNLWRIYTSTKEKLEKRPTLILLNMRHVPSRVTGKTKMLLKQFKHLFIRCIKPSIAVLPLAPHGLATARKTPNKGRQRFNLA